MHRIRNLNKYALSAGESCVLYVQYLLLSQTMYCKCAVNMYSKYVYLQNSMRMSVHSTISNHSHKDGEIMVGILLYQYMQVYRIFIDIDRSQFMFKQWDILAFRDYSHLFANRISFGAVCLCIIFNIGGFQISATRESSTQGVLYIHIIKILIGRHGSPKTPLKRLFRHHLSAATFRLSF